MCSSARGAENGGEGSATHTFKTCTWSRELESSTIRHTILRLASSNPRGNRSGAGDTTPADFSSASANRPTDLKGLKPSSGVLRIHAYSNASGREFAERRGSTSTSEPLAWDPLQGVASVHPHTALSRPSFPLIPNSQLNRHPPLRSPRMIVMRLWGLRFSGDLKNPTRECSKFPFRVMG